MTQTINPPQKNPRDPADGGGGWPKHPADDPADYREGFPQPPDDAGMGDEGDFLTVSFPGPTPPEETVFERGSEAVAALILDTAAFALGTLAAVTSPVQTAGWLFGGRGTRRPDRGRS
jgi:hypothetical protein